MNKERIAFLVTVVLLAGLWFTRGDSEAPARRGRGGGGGHVEAVAGEVRTGNFLADQDYSWSFGKRNVFRAPTETEELGEVPLLPPPLPRLPHPGLPLVPAVRGPLSAALRHELVPDPKLVLTAAAARPAASDGGAEAPAGDDLDTVDTSNVGMTLADRLKMTTEEKAKRARQEEEAKRAESERKKGLDQVVYPSGDVAWGTVVELEKKDDRYVVKDTIDRVRSDASLGEDERRRRLEPIKFVFREDRGPNRPPSRTVLSASAVRSIEFAPNNPVHRYHLAKLHAPADDKDRQESLAKMIFDAGEMTAAAKHLEEMHARGLVTPKSMAMLADANRRLFRYDAELAALDQGLVLFPADVPLLARMGQLCLRLRLVPKAEEAFGKAVEADPANALARLGLAQVLVERDRLDDALVNLRQAEAGVGLDREQLVRVQLLLGEVHLRKGNAQAASASFSQAIDRDPKNPRAHAGIIAVAFATQGAEAAKAAVDRAREAAPLDGTLAYLDGACQLRLGKWTEARDLLLTALELDPLIAPLARTALSYLYEKAGQLEAALAEAEQALVVDPLSLDARLQRARVFLLLGVTAQAREDYLRVLEGMPDRADILVALGDASFRDGNYLDASRFYARAEAGEAMFPDLLPRRVLCDVRRNRLADAEELLKRVDARGEQNPFVQSAQAAFYYKQRKTEEALRRLRLIVEKKAGSPELVQHAASALGAIEDNLAKEKWTDSFNRSGGQLLRGWNRQIGHGVNIAINDGRVIFEGTQRNVSDEPTVLIQEKTGRQFFSFAADLDVKPQTGVYAGIGLVAFNQSPREPDPWPGLQRRDGRNFSHLGLQVAVSPSGKLQWRKIVQGKATEWAEVPGATYEGGPVTLGIEVANVQKSTYRILVDQQVLLPEVDLPGLSRRGGPIEMQVFCQAQIDRPVSFAADNVTIVTYKK